MSVRRKRRQCPRRLDRQKRRRDFVSGVTARFHETTPAATRHTVEPGVRNFPSQFLIGGLLAVALRAGPVESAIVAAMRLPEAANYQWHTEVTDDARTYEIVGATDRATDYSLVTMPMPATTSSGRPGGPRGGRASGGNSNTVTAVFSGDENLVVQEGDAWRRPGERPATAERGRGGPGGFGGPGSGIGGPGVPRGRGPRGGRGPGTDTPTPPSNLQNTLNRPHEEIAVIIAGSEDMKAEGEVISGRLTETSAQLLLVHAGQKDLTPLRASGTFRLWVKAGALVRYETKLEGVIQLETPAGRREYTVHQTATTRVSNVGTTKVDVPEAARKQLGG